MQKLLVEKFKKEFTGDESKEDFNNKLIDCLSWFIAQTNEYEFLQRCFSDPSKGSSRERFSFYIFNAAAWSTACASLKDINKHYTYKVIHDLYTMISPVKHTLVNIDKHGVNISSASLPTIQSSLSYTDKDKKDIIGLYSLWLTRHEKFFNMIEDDLEPEPKQPIPHCGIQINGIDINMY